jgi:Holliday junction resolvase RusA-like endonuclease
MIFHKIAVKPLSINEAYAPRIVRKGRRTYATTAKTAAYSLYEDAVGEQLPKLDVDFSGDQKLIVCLRAFFERDSSDLDNVQKPFQDILQHHYEFNDNRIYQVHMHKHVLGAGHAGIEFYLNTLEGYMKDKQYVRPYRPYGSIIPRNKTKSVVINPVPMIITETNESELYELDRISRVTGSIGQGVHFVVHSDGKVTTLRPDTVRGDLCSKVDVYGIYVRVPTSDSTYNSSTKEQLYAIDELIEDLEIRYGKLTIEEYIGYKR